MQAISHQPMISSIYDRMLTEDDTEESVSGSDFHLRAILALYDVLLRYARDAGLRWYVTAEVLVLANLLDRTRNPWRSMPDVYVVLDLDDAPRISLDTRAGQPFPRFVCEVASESTWERDVEEKQRLYADVGVDEYLVFDPTEQLLGQAVRAWHHVPSGVWEQWQPDEDGYLTSTVLGLRLRAEDQLLRVYAPDQGRLPIATELAALARERDEAATRANAYAHERDEAATRANAYARERDEAAAKAEERAHELAQRLAQERTERQLLEDEIARLRAERGEER